MKTVRHNIIAGQILGIFLIFGVGLWAATTDIAGAVVASGVLVVDSNAKKVQSATGGIVHEIFVRDGTRVKAGDLLLRLDETVPKANLAVIDQEMKGLSDQINSRNAELAFLQKELDGVRVLYQKGLSTIVRLNAVERDHTRTLGERAVLESSVAELVEKRITAKDQLSHIEIRAPQTGIVDQSNTHTVGGVIAPGETLMLIIPDDSLVAEAKIAPKDISNVKYDQKAFLRFTSFSQRTTPEIEGTVTRISADVTNDVKTGQSYYVIRLSISADQQHRLGVVRLVPGMPLEIFIKTEDRSVLSYFVKPLTDQFNRAFREQ